MCDDVRPLLRSVADLTGSQPDLAGMYLSTLALRDPWLADDPLRTRLANAVEAAQATGTIPAGLDGTDLADRFLAVAIGRALSHPGDGAEAVTDWTWTAVLDAA